MKVVYVIGDDKIGRKAMNLLADDQIIYRNQTVDALRVLKLIRRRVVTYCEVFKMLIADLQRKKVKVRDYPIIKSNCEMMEMVEREKPDVVICFRAGLVLSKKVLDLTPRFLNIHCADLPEFGGIGTISRAIKAQKLNQNACLHEIILEIDSGEVLHKEPYQLSQCNTYIDNEDVAYLAGYKILVGIADKTISI